MYGQTYIYDIIDSEFIGIFPNRNATKGDWSILGKKFQEITSKFSKEIIINVEVFDTKCTQTIVDYIKPFDFGTYFVLYISNLDNHSGFIRHGKIVPYILRHHTYKKSQILKTIL